MNAAQWVAFCIQISIAIIVFCVALNASPQDLVRIRRPGFLIRSIFTMNVIMPLFSIGIALLFELNHVVEIALVAMALSPVPPFLPVRQLKAGGAYSSVIGVLAGTALFSILFIPAAIGILARIFGRPMEVPAGSVAVIVGTSILMPLAAGVVFRSIAPSVAKRIARPLSVFATALLVLAFIPVLILEWRTVVALVGDFTLVAITIFVLAGLAAGHLLGGPDPDDRTVLALATATRHPAIAMMIIRDAADQQAALAAILLVLIVGALVSGPYARWRGRAHEHRISLHTMKGRAR